MISSTTPDVLNDLNSVLKRIMSDGRIKDKYTNALEDAIDELNLDQIKFSSSLYSVTIQSTETGGIIIDVFSNDGPIIDTIHYDEESIIGDETAGEA
tara:strand:- start:245 stop:535 length:291 start_codon:yes stop_codon:yes gene_type:complete